MARRENKLTPKEIAIQYASANGFQFLDFDEALDAFIAFCEIKNLREYTLRYYHNELSCFKKTLIVLHIDTTPSSITISDIHQFIAYSRKVANMSPISINTRLRAVRAFFNWLYRDQHIEHNPVENLSLLRTRRREIQTFSERQLRQILQQPNLQSFVGVRDYTIMLTLIDTGIRVNELVHTTVSDVHFSESRLFIREPKGEKCRNVPLSTKLKRQIHKYLAIRGTLDTDALFVTVDGKPLPKRQVQINVHKYGEMAGIKDVRCSPHTFRHTFAKLSVQNGANVFELQQILGHSTLDMTRVYVNLFSKDVIKGHRSFSPLENLSNLK